MITKNEMDSLMFEDALKKLEQIVTQLDDGELSLEDSIEQYEIGMKLREHCEKLIKNAELRILKITDKEKIETDKLTFGDHEKSQ